MNRKCLRSEFPTRQHFSTNFFPLHFPIPPLPITPTPFPNLIFPFHQVQDAVRCRMGGCKDDSENSPDSCKNGQVQIMVNSISFHLILQVSCPGVTLTTLLFTSTRPCLSCKPWQPLYKSIPFSHFCIHFQFILHCNHMNTSCYTLFKVYCTFKVLHMFFVWTLHSKMMTPWYYKTIF